MKDQKPKTVLHGFIEIVKESKRQPNKLWVDQGRELYNSPMQKWLDDNILIYSTHNKGKSVVSETFIKTLKGKIYNKMTANDSKSCPSYLNKLVDEYNNTYHHSISKKHVDVNYYALFEEIEINLEASKF